MGSNEIPGVRADNDMYTYGFSFDPWKGSIIGNGKEIKNYLNKVTDKFNIKKNILFDTEVRSLSWKDNKWVIKLISKSLLVNTLFVAPVQEIEKPTFAEV